jgi:xanthine dehydrogenase molybdopterin-binding subunit B
MMHMCVIVVSFGRCVSLTCPGDEEVFASTQVGYVGQPVGVIVANTHEIAEAAAKLVIVAYGPGSKPILTIPDAIAANSFLVDNTYIQHIPSIVSGDIDKGFADSDFTIDGTLETGGQAHFYMETQTVRTAHPFAIRVRGNTHNLKMKPNDVSCGC